MSTRPQPTGKQMIMQQVMLALVVFLGFQLMCNNKQTQGPADTRTAQQVLGDANNPGPLPRLPDGTIDLSKATVYQANAALYDSSVSQINTTYQNKVDEELKAKENKTKDPVETKRLEDEAQANRLQGVIAVADTQYKAGRARNEIGRTRMAFQTLQGWERSLQSTPVWTQPFPVPSTLADPGRFPWRQWSGESLMKSVTEDLSTLNKKDLIYGVFPGYEIIDFLVRLTGSHPDFSYAFAAFLLALCVRAIIFPLAQKQLMWGRKMQQLQPLVKEIREQYTDKKTKQVTNQAELQQRTMALYGEYGINPLAGCLPALVQFPLFITVYQFMLHYQFEFAKGHFLWINPGTSAATHGFFAPNLGVIDRPLIVVYGITMVTSTLLMPVSDPSQVKQQRIMGVGIGLMMTVFMFLGMFPVPGAFVLYWTFTNLLATIQSLRAYRMPLPPLEKVNTKAGGVFPMPPFKDGGGGSIVNGKPNGKPTGPVITPKTTTGTPAKHKPKKRK